MNPTARLTYRKPDPADLPAWTNLYLSPRARFIGGGEEADAGKAWRAFAAILGHWQIHGCGLYVFCEAGTGRAIGTVGPWYPALWPEKELGWTVWHEADEGTGLAYEAAKAAVDHAYAALGWETAVSYIDPANARSIALAKRLGAVLDPAAESPQGDILVFRHTSPGNTRAKRSQYQNHTKTIPNPYSAESAKGAANE